MSETNTPHVLDTLGRAQELVKRLLDAGHTHAMIAEALGGRVSARSVYRWAKGEHAPQRQSDLVALERLLTEVEGS
jgi:hypothetical protein